ncbi:PPE domain-containing protein [Rhodococcus triatomae]|nr:PPE domain-containing protein [Rhodococcus triatomae]QNG19315.1 PPE domain-containing protein [Rhodococcus triatomae]QNG24772.1 PPE domain-containing protein [Rhodococcus triatomae]
MNHLGATISGATSDFVNSLSGKNQALLGVADSVLGTDVGGWAASRSAQEAGNDRRSELYSEANGLAGLGLTPLPPGVTSMESFESMPHADIKAKVDSMRPGEIYESAQSWRGAQDMVTELVDTFRNAIGTVTESDWTGTAARAAHGAVTAYAADTEKFSGAVTLVANKLEEAYTGFEQTKHQLPEPDDRSFGDWARAGVGLLAGSGFGLTQLVAGGSEAHQQAIQVMRTVYTPVVVQSDMGVPALPPPVNPINAPGPNPLFPGTGGGGGVGGGGASVLPGIGGGDPFASPPIDPASTSAASVGAGLPSGLTPPGGHPGLGGANEVPRTAAASANPFAPPPGWGGSGGAGGGLGSGGGIGSGGGAGLMGPAAPPAGGQSQQAGGAARGNAAAGAGRGGMMGGGMMGGGGARGQGDQDKEHKTADYLVTVENGNELIGDLPAVAPPVIGA